MDLNYLAKVALDANTAPFDRITPAQHRRRLVAEAQAELELMTKHLHEGNAAQTIHLNANKAVMKVLALAELLQTQPQRFMIDVKQEMKEANES